MPDRFFLRRCLSPLIPASGTVFRKNDSHALAEDAKWFSPFFLHFVPVIGLARTFLLPFFAIGLFLLTTPMANAANQVVLIPVDGDGTSRNIGLFSGSNLPTDSYVRIGTFNSGGTNAAQLASFVGNWSSQASSSSLLSFLNNDFVDWNSTNTASNPWLGSSSLNFANTNTATNLVGKPMYLWVYNTSTAASATNSGSQMLILRSWETNELGSGFPDKNGTSFGLDSTLNLFPSTPSGISFVNPDDGEPYTSYGVSVLFGQYVSDSLQFRLGAITPRSEITSPLTQTNAVGAVSTYQITANNGPDLYFATTSTSNPDLTTTNLPAGFSIATNTGVITVATNAATNTYSIRLVASNSVTASIATNILTWVLKTPTLSFTNVQSPITATLGKGMTSNFSSTGINPTYTVTFGKLFGLTLDTSNGVGVLSGTPDRLGSNSVWIQATAGTNVGATNFTLVVNPFSLGIVGLTDAGVLECTAGVAQTNRVTNSEAYTDLDGDFNANPATPGLIFNGSELVIPSSTLPLLKGSSNIVLTLTASKDVDGIRVSSSTTVPLRIVPPTPTRLVGPTEFEVDVGEPFSATILTDVGSLTQMFFSNLPPGLSGGTDGIISGVNNNSGLPNEYSATVVANSSLLYEGGSVSNYIVTFRLRNTNPPIFSPLTNRVLASVGKNLSLSLNVLNSPYAFAASNLPTGLSLVENTISGTPASVGIFTSTVTAYNSYRPGSTSLGDRQPGYGAVVFSVANAKPPTSVAPANPGVLAKNVTISLNDDRKLLDAVANGVMVSALGLPPGISLESTTGKIFGTPSTGGTFLVTVFIQNGKGWVRKGVTLTVQ